MSYEYDYTLLEKRIDEKFGNQENFAIAMKVARTSINMKLNGHVPFKQPEISKAVEVLEIRSEELFDYFFTRKVKIA